MKKLNRVAMLFATAAMATAAGAQTIDNWRNGTSELVWKNGTNELCWRDASWTPATAAKGCDGAIVPAAAPAPAESAPDLGELWRQSQTKMGTSDYVGAIELLTRIYEQVAFDPDAKALRLRVQWALHEAHIGAEQPGRQERDDPGPFGHGQVRAVQRDERAGGGLEPEVGPADEGHHADRHRHRDGGPEPDRPAGTAGRRETEQARQRVLQVGREPAAGASARHPCSSPSLSSSRARPAPRRSAALSSGA